MAVKLANAEQAEEAELVVCMRVSDADRQGIDLTGRGALKTACAECGAPVYYAPTCPQRPPKVCLQCVTVKMRAARAAGEDIDVMVGEEALR